MPGPPCTGFRCPVCGRDVAARRLSRREQKAAATVVWAPDIGLLSRLFTPWFGWRCVRCGLQVERGTGPIRRSAEPLEQVACSRVVLQTALDRVPAIKALRQATRTTLRGARDAVDGAPCELGVLPTDAARALQARMAAARATVDLHDVR